MTVGERLKAWRESTKRADGKSLSQAEVAKLAGCTQAMWGCLESGEKQPGVNLALAVESLTEGAIPVEAWATRDIPPPPSAAEPASHESGEHAAVDHDAASGAAQ